MQLLKISEKAEYYLIPDAVWTGTGKTPLRNNAVHIKNGYIQAILKSPDIPDRAAVPAQYGKQSEIVRLPGVTLLPGFIDCHIHLSMDGHDLPRAIKEWDDHPEATEKRVQDELAAYLKHGILAVRDGGDKKNIGLKAKKAVAAGRRTGPYIVATGQAIYRKDMYGSFLGPGISNLKEVLPAVKEIAAKGADQLKVVVSGLVSFKKFGVVGAPQFTADELSYIVKTGHAYGLKVMAHASSRAAVDIAVAAGVDSVEHGYFLSDSTIARMAEQGTYWVPTVAPLGNLVKDNRIPYPGADLDVIKGTCELQLKQIANAHAAGVILGIGTDAGANTVPHGVSYFDELNYFREAGLDWPSILRTATRHSAIIAGLESIMGTVEPGKKPYLVGVESNPLDLPAPFKSPVFICLPV